MISVLQSKAKLWKPALCFVFVFMCSTEQFCKGEQLYYREKVVVAEVLRQLHMIPYPTIVGRVRSRPLGVSYRLAGNISQPHPLKAVQHFLCLHPSHSKIVVI